MLPIIAVSINGRRPMRSDSLPHSGMTIIDRPMATALTVRIEVRSIPPCCTA